MLGSVKLTNAVTYDFPSKWAIPVKRGQTTNSFETALRVLVKRKKNQKLFNSRIFLIEKS